MARGPASADSSTVLGALPSPGSPPFALPTADITPFLGLLNFLGQISVRLTASDFRESGRVSAYEGLE